MSLADLPAVNACLNGLSAVLLAAGYACIRRGNKSAHRNCMISAFTTSAIFLICYLTYHFTVKTITRFKEPEWFRPIYLSILFSHLALALAIIPLALITLRRAVKWRFELHKKVARWSWPIWMYVSVTGVIIYLLLYRIFPQH